MKLLITILSLIFIPKECNNSISNYNELQKKQDSITITYKANTRGYYEEISVSKNTLKVCNDINKKRYETFECTQVDWEACLQLLSKINIDSLSKLEAPTSMRFSDGAAHATLIINDGNKEIRSSEFDHGHPPKEIKELIEKLLALKKMAVKQ